MSTALIDQNPCIAPIYVTQLVPPHPNHISIKEGKVYSITGLVV
jgi:hypothetical protein